MIKDKFGQFIYNKNEIFNMIMEGIEFNLPNILVTEFDDTEIKQINNTYTKNFVNYVESNDTQSNFDHKKQNNWYMPDEYKSLDIAEHILKLCNTQAELQRCGKELLMYQERGLFDLLRYLVYLVDVMEKNNIIWGVGRGSSVSSYVLYKLKVHKVDSMYFELNIEEFLR